VFWFRVLAVAQVALLARRHLQLLETDERKRLAGLVAKSKGRPRKNLSANEREEMLRLVKKLDPGAFGRGAFRHVRGGAGKKK
jgi:hypothetical protein